MFPILDLFGEAITYLEGWSGPKSAQIVISDPIDSEILSDAAGKVWVASLEGKVLCTFAAEGAQDFFGQTILGGYDLDGKGVEDLIIGAPQSVRNGFGYVSVYRGEDRTLLYKLDVPASAADDPIGSVGGPHVIVLEAGGDGGRAELVIGLPLGNERAGELWVCDGLTGARLDVIRGHASDYLGARLLTLPDLDGDQHSEFVAAAPGAGCVRVFSGKSRTKLMDLSADADSGLTPSGGALAFDPHGLTLWVPALKDGKLTCIIGYSLRTAGSIRALDLEGNDVTSIAVVGPSRGQAASTLLVAMRSKDEVQVVKAISLSDEKTVFQLVESRWDAPGFGSCLKVIPDRNGDNCEDFVVGVSTRRGRLAFEGEARVYSGKDGRLLRTFKKATLGG